MPLVVISPAQGLSSSKRALNIVVLAEGFLATRVDVFLSQVRKFDRVLRATSPFHRFKDLVTVSALFVPSAVSLAGITNATRCAWRVPNPAGVIPGDDAPSPFATPFAALYCRARDSTPARAFMPRILRGDVALVKAAIAAEPVLTGLDVASLVLVDNTQAVGGAAKDGVGWFSMNAEWIQVAIHELGHSVFDLADEYDTDGPSRHAGPEPMQPNVTLFANHAALGTGFAANPNKRSLIRWHDLMDPATPSPASQPNTTCTQLSSPEKQLMKPGVNAQTVGLFEGAQYAPCAVFRPRFGCRMRDHAREFCPVCEWAIGTKLARTQNLMHVNTRVTVPGAWTVLGFYHEERTRVLVGNDLGRFVFYAATTGEYRVQTGITLREPPPPPVSNPGVTIDALWTSLATCEIGGLPHLLAHSLPLRRLGIFEVVDDAGKARLDIQFDSGINAVPWTHVTTFVSSGVPHMLAYEAGTGHVEISRLSANNQAPTIVSGTALDPTNLFLPGYTIITTLTVDGVPHVLKHNATDGVVHVQSLDPPGKGPNTFISKPGHWSPGATTAIGYEVDGRTFVHRTSLSNYEALDWVWPGGTGVEMQIRKQSLDLTLALTRFQGKTASGIQPFGIDMIVAMDVVGGRVRMMSLG
jgi:hypothetical protein